VLPDPTDVLGMATDVIDSVDPYVYVENQLPPSPGHSTATFAASGCVLNPMQAPVKFSSNET